MTDELLAVPATPTHDAGLDLRWSDSSPAALAGLRGSTLLGGATVSLVELFTAAERRARTSQAYYRSAVGERLRVVNVEQTNDDTGAVTIVSQLDPVSGLYVRTALRVLAGADAVQVWSSVENTSDEPIVITDAATLCVGFGDSEGAPDTLSLLLAESEWLAENRWREIPLREALPRLGLELHAQDGRGHFSRSSHGAWSTGEHLPTGAIVDRVTGEGFGWQIETSSPWSWDLTQTLGGGILTLSGPSGQEHGFAQELRPGQTLDTVSATLVTSRGGRDGVFAELTRARRALRSRETDGADLPIVYNDFMNTLMGQPSTEALLPLIDAAADAGVECFCIDAGWFADPAIGDWWATVGEWREAPSRFTDGLRAVVDAIHARGMRSGIWLEPEVVGVQSPVARTLPDEAFFMRFGHRVQEDRRFHLDLRHPAARAHLDATMDHLIDTFGFSFFKLDYNINPGPGTEYLATSAGQGLLGHTRALRDWLVSVQERHPDILIENCSSGGMRADYALLSVLHMQSTSDQQNFELYPPIAASAPASIVPEQCGNWAYPHADMSLEDTAFTMVTGLSGRLYLSGFLNELSPARRGLVHDGVAVHTELRDRLRTALPFWPAGLPQWDDDLLILGLRTADEDLLFVWDRGEPARELVLPVVAAKVEEIYPRALPSWSPTPGREGVVVRTPAGRSARVLRLHR